MQPADPPGLRFHDATSDREMLLVYEPHALAGWICYRHADGPWVTLRRATEDDKAEISRVVVKAHHGE